MPANRFLVMRHGESLANVSARIVSDPARGIPDFGLTEVGREQVRAAVGAHDFLRSVTDIHSSDFRRARETAELVRELLGLDLPLRLEPALRERGFGAFEGRESSCYQEVWSRDREHPEDPGDGIEPAAAVLARAREVMRRLDASCRDRTVLLVCHGDVAQILLAAAAGRAAHEHRQVEHLPTAGVRMLGAAVRG